MRAGLKPSILGQWLCAGDLGSGRGRGAGAGCLPPKSNVEPVLRRPCRTYWGEAVLPPSAKYPKGHVAPHCPGRGPCLLGGSLPISDMLS